MAGLREIQNRIKSIQDTRKITNAMYMISSTKMRKAKQDLENTEPYFYTLQSMMDRMLRHLPDVSHMYFENEGVGGEATDTSDKKNIGLLVITGDKGLAGAYNHNVLKLAQEYLDDQDNEIQLFVVGELGRQYFMGQHIPFRKISSIRPRILPSAVPAGLLRSFLTSSCLENWTRLMLSSPVWKIA